MAQNQSQDAMATGDFKLHAAWAQMRRRHAQECHNFVVAHNKAARDHFYKKVGTASAKASLKDWFQAFLIKHQGFYTVSTLAYFKQLTVCRSWQ